MNLAVDNKDVENGVDEVIDLIATLWNGFMAFLDVLPPIVQGILVFIVLVLAAKKIFD